MKNRKKILITGATGFIGSHLTDKLIQDNRANIRAIVLENPIDDIEIENLERLKIQGVEIVYGDLRNKKSLTKAVKNIDTIFHLGAISRPMQIDKQIYYDTNATGTKNLLDALLKYSPNFKKFVHISTVSVLGLSPDGHPLKEDEFQIEDQDYGLSKRKGEKIALEYQKKYNIPLTVVRPCLIYGPRCMVRLIMFKFTKKRLFPIFNGGKAKMEFCYVSNLVKAILLAEKNPKAIGQKYNITDGQSYTIKKILTTIAKHEKVGEPIIRMPYFIGKIIGHIAEFIFPLMGKYPPFSSTAADWMSKDVNVYSCEKAKKELRYKPDFSLDQGIKETVRWYKNKKAL